MMSFGDVMRGSCVLPPFGWLKPLPTCHTVTALLLCRWELLETFALPRQGRDRLRARLCDGTCWRVAEVVDEVHEDFHSLSQAQTGWPDCYKLINTSAFALSSLRRDPSQSR